MLAHIFKRLITEIVLLMYNKSQIYEETSNRRDKFSVSTSISLTFDCSANSSVSLSILLQSRKEQRSANQGLLKLDCRSNNLV